MSAPTGYSNAFSVAKVTDALLGRIGWRQPSETGFMELDSDVTASASGRYFDDFHALVTAKNLYDVVSDPDITDPEFQEWLVSLHKSVIMRSVNNVLRDPELIEQVLLFDREGMFDLPIENSGLFVGYKINVAHAFDYATQIDSVSLLFDSDVTFKLYLFKDGRKGKVWEQSVSVTAGDQKVVDLDNLLLKYIDDNAKGGIFYFGYFQDDLGGARAIREQVACWNKTHVFSACPFGSKKVEDEVNFNRNQIYESGFPYGMNLEVSTFKDYTTQIIRKANLFDELIGLQMAALVIEIIANATRSNGGERLLKDNVDKLMAYMDVHGTAPISNASSTTGLAKRIQLEYDRIRATFFRKPLSQTVNASDLC